MATACSVGMDGLSYLDVDDRIDALTFQAVADEAEEISRRRDLNRARMIASEVRRMFG